MKRIFLSDNHYRGKQITSSDRICQLAEERKSVYHTNWKIKPAAFIMGMQLRVVNSGIKKKMFFEIKKIKGE